MIQKAEDVGDHLLGNASCHSLEKVNNLLYSAIEWLSKHSLDYGIGISASRAPPPLREPPSGFRLLTMHLPRPTLPPERVQDTAAKFKRYYYLILGRLWLILLIIAVGVGGAWAWLQRQPFIYASTATIFVEQAEPRVITKMERVENEKPESAEFVLTAAQMLRSKELLLRV